MKKYIKPTVQAIEIKNDSILAGSDPSLNNAQGNGSWHSKIWNGEDWDEEDY